MRARLFDQLRCDNCKHYIPKGGRPWCQKHYNDPNPDGAFSDGNQWCHDFKLKPK